MKDGFVFNSPAPPLCLGHAVTALGVGVALPTVAQDKHLRMVFKAVRRRDCVKSLIQ